jgi:hypothetical protein
VKTCQRQPGCTHRPRPRRARERQTATAPALRTPFRAAFLRTRLIRGVARSRTTPDRGTLGTSIGSTAAHVPVTVRRCPRTQQRHSPQSPYRSPTWGFSQAVHRSAVVIPSAFQVNRARDVALHPQADQLSGAVIPTNTAAIHRALHSLTHVPFLLRSPTNSGRSARPSVPLRGSVPLAPARRSPVTRGGATNDHGGTDHGVRHQRPSRRA